MAALTRVHPMAGSTAVGPVPAAMVQAMQARALAMQAQATGVARMAEQGARVLGTETRAARAAAPALVILTAAPAA